MAARRKFVTIRLRGSRVRVDRPHIEISKSRRECVCWVCPDARAVVQFRKSPFLRNRRKFVVRKGRVGCLSPAVRANVPVGARFKYWVRIGKAGLDPVVEVRT